MKGNSSQTVKQMAFRSYVKVIQLRDNGYRVVFRMTLTPYRHRRRRRRRHHHHISKDLLDVSSGVPCQSIFHHRSMPTCYNAVFLPRPHFTKVLVFQVGGLLCLCTWLVVTKGRFLFVIILTTTQVFPFRGVFSPHKQGVDSLFLFTVNMFLVFHIKVILISNLCERDWSNSSCSCLTTRKPVGSQSRCGSVNLS